MARIREWFVCDEMRETPCVYDSVTAARLKSDPLRCIRHGSLMFSDRFYDGMTRAQVRAKVDGGG